MLSVDVSARLEMQDISNAVGRETTQVRVSGERDKSNFVLPKGPWLVYASLVAQALVREHSCGRY